jgi:hypothetical protein
MEFPPEILSIIREYSRPFFKYFKEYNRALRIHSYREWPKLKRALLRNPVDILRALEKHERALFLSRTIRTDYNQWFQTYLDNHCRDKDTLCRKALENIDIKYNLDRAREEIIYLLRNY